VHLIIAEKNIAAQRIAQILAGKEKTSTAKEGGVNAYRFDDVVVMGLRGHVVEVDFEPGYTNWRSDVYTPRSLIDAGTVKKPTEKKIVALIHKLAKSADIVTIATDFDTEGELIGKEAYELVRQKNATVPVHRSRFSAITAEEIRNAFAHPVEIDFNLAAAGESRQHVDLMWGASLTRFISIAARRGGSNILSVGRVQSPTLAMIVDREKEIEAFVPEPYWMLSLETHKGGHYFEVRHTHGRFWDRAEAEGARARSTEPLVATEVRTGEKTSKPPSPFDTTSFIVAAARLGFSAANAMRIAEDLYMNGHISYPRTDNTVYPPSLDLNGTLAMLGASAFAAEAQWVQNNRRERPTRGKKSSTDHPPIHPTGAVKRGVLPDDQWKIYELVVRRFLATLSPDAKWKTLKYLFDAGGEPYTATGQRLAEEGYRHVYPYSDAKEYLLPDIDAGERLPIHDVHLEEKETQPPARYSQSKLIQRMEELGLGTKSTRHEVIAKLMARRYVEGTPMRPTLVGRAVTESLENHVELITKPDMTRTLESHMEEIKKGSRSRENVVAESQGMLHEVFDALETHEDQIGEEIMERTEKERIIGPCPVCGKDLTLRYARGMKQFIGCSGYPECTFNIGLPGAQWGRALRTDTVCEKHNLHFVRLVRKGARPWDIGCPLCTHIESNRETLHMMPSMTDTLIERLHAHHTYSVFEIAQSDTGALARKLEVSEGKAARLQDEAESVLQVLRKRSELRKFVRKHLPPRRGRSHGKILNALFAAGINTIADLAATPATTLASMKIGEKEAAHLLSEARNAADEAKLRELGIPPVSLKKYREAGITAPEDFCTLHPAYLSSTAGLSIDTVQKHVEKVCAGMGVKPPAKVSKKEFEQGQKRLLSIPGIGESTLERLYMAGIVDPGTLLACDVKSAAKKSGLSADKINAYKEAARAA
jgi:DNA topoisomerase-1